MGEDRIDMEVQEDEEVRVGSEFVYDDALLNDLFNDKFGLKRAETTLKKAELMGATTNVSGQVWTVC